jgi:hypothetical protein
MADTAAAAASAAPAQTSQPTGQQTSANPAPQQQQSPTQPKSWSTKVDGKDVTWSNENELIRDAGLGKAAFQRMRDAAEQMKSVTSFWETFQKDPMAALNHPNLKLTKEQKRDLIEKYYQKEYLETDQLTPDQKRIRELEAEKAARDEKDRKDAQTKESERQSQLAAKWQETYQKQIIEAIEKGGFPKTPRTAARVAFYMAQAAESGFDAPLETIIAQVGRDYEQELQAILADGVPMEAILKVIPPAFLKRLRKYDLDQYKTKQAKLNAPPSAREESKGSAPKKNERMSYAQVLKKLGG